MRKIDTDYVIWGILAIPALLVMQKVVESPVHGVLTKASFRTAEYSAYLLVISLMATPLMLLFRGKFGTRWLVSKRRYIGVAALGYGVLHTMFYFLHRGVTTALGETFHLHVLTGWIILLILIPLGWTSRDSSIRAMGTKWKQLQRWVYPAAALTVLHWAVQFNWQVWKEPLFYFAPLAALTVYRLWYNLTLERRRAARAQA